MNPFEAFRSYNATRRELPLDRILARRDQVLQQLLQSYQALIDEIRARLSPANHEVAVELASLPAEIRGFGHVKEANLARAKSREETLLVRFRSAPPHALAAE